MNIYLVGFISPTGIMLVIVIIIIIIIIITIIIIIIITIIIIIIITVLERSDYSTSICSCLALPSTPLDLSTWCGNPTGAPGRWQVECVPGMVVFEENGRGFFCLTLPRGPLQGDWDPRNTHRDTRRIQYSGLIFLGMNHPSQGVGPHQFPYDTTMSREGC